MIENISLEMSLKPFRQMTKDYVAKVMHRIYGQWKPLVQDAKTVSIMLWTADGSEILEYSRDMDQPIEWCNLVGGANLLQPWNRQVDPERLGLHTRNYPYMKDAPVLTYGILRQIIQTIKEVGEEELPGKRIRVGETFDPGPEFAKSSFKYERHNEICLGESMGKNSMVCCYTVLHKDPHAYAGFPEGIEEGTPIGTFLGRQSQAFLTDMGFDYLWLSNGLGFGTNTWETTGAIFDGSTFHTENFSDVKEKVLNFWKLFRAECPDIPLECRGTNMTAGIDYATDGVPLKSIYNGNFELLPPPNSPWAALDGDFGLELAGYMSRISELPNREFLFRYYIHDPWWVNSPWYDRYEGQPHDIYLPLAVGRIDEDGRVNAPTHMNILSIDTTFGETPETCVNEPIPHILKAIKDAPDEPSPFVWVYPFDEYMDTTDAPNIMRAFSEDWFIRGAINEGFPLSTVVSTGSFNTYRDNLTLYRDSILVTPVPRAESTFEKNILSYIQAGGKVIFYGTTQYAGSAFMHLFSLARSEEVEGELDIRCTAPDRYADGKLPEKMMHRPLVCAGGVDTKLDSDIDLNANTNTDVEIIASAGDHVLGVKRGAAVWLRGTVSASYSKHSRLLTPDQKDLYLCGETLLRTAAARLGYMVSFAAMYRTDKLPVLMISRSDKAYMFSVYAPNTTVKTRLHFPLGAPVLMGYDTALEDGCSTYHFPRAEHKECRAFVVQKEGIITAKEIPPVSFQMRRRILIGGLDHATVRFFPERYCQGDIKVVLNSQSDNYFVGDPWEGEYHLEEGYFEVRNVTGNLVFSMPRYQK